MSRRSAALAAVLILSVTGGALLAMGRPAICTCGEIALWAESGPKQSQMLADWYSPSHVIHGFLFFAALWLVRRRWNAEVRFLAALVIECAWEVVENTPLIIDRYREATAALGYTGDSVLNSMSDVAMMAIGYLAARRLPLWASVIVVIVLELLALAVIRDNLTLNIWMLLFPNEALRNWQAAG